ncbi:MAG: PEGA domain-containing protein [Polyangia bacterium]
MLCYQINYQVVPGALPLKKPIQFGKYFLLDRINVGGMAEVFKAKAFGVEGFERLLAVKRILPNIAEDEEFITMFIDEAKISVQLNHANICQIFDLGKVEDSYFIALEFVHGKDLRAIFDRCKQKPVDGLTAMPIAQAAFVVMKACEGLDYAHNKRDANGGDLNLVHRDVSPQNVLISYEGEVKLIDFGIAKAAGKASKTQQGILKGKFGYMSPEQVRGLPLDRRSDIFSLGIVLYELLTGERLFIGESDFSTLEKVRNVEILPPSTYNRRIPEELERIVMKALAKDVEDRYQNAIDLHDDLQAFMYSAGEFYSRKDLAAWMKKVFASEIEAETAKLDAYQKLPPPTQPAAGAAPAGGLPVGPSSSRRNTIPPPPPAAAMSGRPSGQMPAVAPPPPAIAAKPVNGHAPGARAEADLGWDDEELATNIYDTPQDAADAVVDDKPDLSHLELRADGAPVPHGGKQNGAAHHPAPIDFVMPQPAAQPALAPVARPVHLPTEQMRAVPVGRPQKGRGALYLTVGVIALVCATAVGGYLLLGNKPGQVMITSEPSVNVQVLVDNKRIPVDGTPATLKLDPGSYVLTVQREGYVPWNQQVEVKAGEIIRKQITLEPLASGTGFTLVSEPSGLQAMFDGKPLGITPLKVQSVSPGTHKIDVAGPNGTTWSQNVELEAGKIAEVRAVLPAAIPTPTPPATGPSHTAERVAERTPSEKSAKSKEPSHEEREPAHVKATPAAHETSPLPRLADVDLTPKPKTHEEKKPVEKPVATPEPAATGSGFLRIGSKPWTTIALDGKDTGLHTPQTQMKVAAGSHRITLSNPQFKIRQTFSVDIKAGETITVIKDLRPQGGDSD